MSLQKFFFIRSVMQIRTGRRRSREGRVTPSNFIVNIRKSLSARAFEVISRTCEKERMRIEISPLLVSKSYFLESKIER